uniref:NB-ARC domain-containing protein n=1 Tax=Oryza meridionalis TaxID=40149 RepID=A0A0E0BW13_9ORYZ
MEAAVGAANWVVGMVLNKLSDELMAGYMASRELGRNMDQIKRDLNYMLGLLQAAEGREIADNLGLQRLLGDLCNKADEAEDVLDELHYFIIRDEFDGTREATPDLGAQLQHARHAARNTAAELSFDRVALSQKIKSLIQDIHSICPPISDLLQKCSVSVPTSMERPNTSSVITQKKLYGRDAIFDQAMEELLKGGIHHTQDYISVLPIVGPGGVGKTTFAQHLYNDNRTKQHFTVMVWVCVSTNFDVTELTRKILRSLDATESQGTNRGYETSDLDQLHKSIQEKLKSKRFLIVLDDIWEHDSSKAASTKSFTKAEWEKLLAPFGTGETNGNMVLVTTRETQDENDKEKLIDIGKQIAKKLKCNPLAAKTVGPLLRKKSTRKHWMEILEKQEWLKQKDGDASIIPALKISYDYLPFYLKKCFSYCALFPEDYKFDSLEMSCFWDSIGIIYSSGKNDKIEDIGSQYLNELYDNGFLMKVDDKHYVMHDLLHELSHTVTSSGECASINYSSFKADDILPSIRHLSITIEGKYVESFKGEMEKLKERVDIRNLRSVMIFGSYKSKRIANVLKDTLDEMMALRVLFIFINSPNSLPNNFSKLVHLRYLKIGSWSRGQMCIPSTVSKLSKLYHLKFLDLKSWDGSHNLPKDFSRLINLRHFLAKNEFHSNISEVGKMKKCLQELKEFHVKKDTSGFELAQLGQLEELRIRGLENVSREEAIEAKLKDKSKLTKLELVCGTSRTEVVSNIENHDDDILDSLRPHSNLTELSIVNLGGGVAPSWLGSNIHVTNLHTLHLHGVSWATLVPVGKIRFLRELQLRNIIGMCQFGPDFPGGTTNTSFRYLKNIMFEAMPDFAKWFGGANSHLFSGLESLHCIDCPKLNDLPLSNCSSSSPEETNTIWFPNLCCLNIKRCPELSLTPVTHTSTLTDFCLDKCVSSIYETKRYKTKLIVTMVLWPSKIWMARTKTTMPQVAFQLEHLRVDSISAVLVTPVCSFLFPTLRELSIYNDDRVKSFSDKHEGALQLLTSLKTLAFWDLKVLQSLPQGLHRLPSLTWLIISGCPEINRFRRTASPITIGVAKALCFQHLHDECSPLFGSQRWRVILSWHRKRAGLLEQGIVLISSGG